MKSDEENSQLPPLHLSNAESIPIVRDGVEQELIEAKEELQRKTGELEHSLALLRATLDSTADGILVLDEGGRIADFNRKLVKMWGLQAEDLKAMDVGKLRNLVSGQIKESWLFLQSTPANESFDLLELKDGRLFEQFSQKQRVQDRSVGHVWSFRDVTERKRTEDAQYQLAAVVESSDDAIISKTLEGVITTWNSGAERLFGYTAREAIGQPIFMLIPAELQKEEPTILERLKRGERIEHYETIRVRKDGSRLNISLTVSPVKDSRGKIVGASKIARDITDEKRRQDALRESELRFRVLADSAPMLIWESDVGGGCRYFNKTWLNFVGRTLEQEAGNGWLESIHPEDLKRFLETYTLSFDARQTFEMEYRILHRSGEYRWLLNQGTPRFGPQGTFQGYIGAGVDITDSVRAKETLAERGEDLERLVNERTASLREAVAQMEEFSYSVSHDLRAPLRAMQGYATALLEDYQAQLDGEVQEYLERIVSSCQRMDRLTRDVLVYSKIPQAAMELKTVSVERVVSDIVQQHFDSKSQTVIVVERPLFNVKANESFLSQAVSNLIANAVKFASPGKPAQVRIWTEANEGQVRLWVEDNGIGIKPEHQARIWGMFERIHPQHLYEGTGIGLAIVRKTVERMNGTLGVISDGRNGSKFWIQLQADKK